MNQGDLFFVLDGKTARLFRAIEVVEINGVPSIAANEISSNGKTIGESRAIPTDLGQVPQSRARARAFAANILRDDCYDYSGPRGG